MQFHSTSITAAFLALSLSWVLFLILDLRSRPKPSPFISSLHLLLHAIPALFWFSTSIAASHGSDPGLVWFSALFVFRYWRTVVNIFFWFRYQLAVSDSKSVNSGKDCTVVVPTVGPAGNPVFVDMTSAILVNGPSRLIFSTNTDEAAHEIEKVMPSIVKDLLNGTSAFQRQWNLEPLPYLATDIQITSANVSNKRRQVIAAFEMVKTNILIMVDDTAIWHPNFLRATLPAFDAPNVGFVGTRKWVQRLPRLTNPEASFLKNLWLQYWSGLWNTLGALYLIRHNFEIRATNAADGGVFCVSGRSSLIRTEIVNHKLFKHAFLNEYVLRFGDRFPGWGPVTADDDNFITRWVINNGWDIKIQYSEEATMTTVLGKFPLKFPDQCLRWSRTTFRQNPIALFVDRTVWWKWPLTVHTTYFPWMYNAALVWDSLMLFALTRTQVYATSEHPRLLVLALVLFIWATKLVKTLPWFLAHPQDFLLYFLIPAYPLFAYYHSLLKIYTAFTFWDLAWSGRKLK